jgi:lipopolysaccharide transport system permease protein
MKTVLDQSTSERVTVIKASNGWRLIDFKELIEYRDLFYFLVWRNIKILYAQTILGFSWAIVQPLVQIVIFTIVFGKVARLATDGIPYILFYMSQAMSLSSQSLVTGQNMLGKVYFPRMLFPITPVLSKLVDFSISLVLILIALLYYRVEPTWNLCLVPLFILMMISIPAGIGMWLSALAIRFRDVKHAMPFVIRMLIYSAPILYSASKIPPQYRIVYSFNPIVGVIEGMRASLLGTAMPWSYIWPGMISTIVLLLSGALYFRRMERIFADVI